MSIYQGYTQNNCLWWQWRRKTVQIVSECDLRFYVKSIRRMFHSKSSRNNYLQKARFYLSHLSWKCDQAHTQYGHILQHTPQINTWDVNSERNYFGSTHLCQPINVWYMIGHLFSFRSIIRCISSQNKFGFVFEEYLRSRL